jgi:hypothetical protein
VLTPIHPSRLQFTCRTRPIFNGDGDPGSESEACQGPPGARSPFAHSRCYLLRRGVSHPVRGHYPSFKAHTGSCARPNPSRRLRSSLFRRVFAECRQSLCEMALPGVISATLSPHAWTRTPMLPLVFMPVSSQETSAFATSGAARHHTQSVPRLPYGVDYGAAVIHSCSGLRLCSPPRSLLPPCCHWATVAFTSEPNLCCYLHRHRIC